MPQNSRQRRAGGDSLLAPKAAIVDRNARRMRRATCSVLPMGVRYINGDTGSFMHGRAQCGCPHALPTKRCFAALCRRRAEESLGSCSWRAPIPKPLCDIARVSHDEASSNSGVAHETSLDIDRIASLPTCQLAAEPSESGLDNRYWSDKAHAEGGGSPRRNVDWNDRRTVRRHPVAFAQLALATTSQNRTSKVSG